VAVAERNDVVGLIQAGKRSRARMMWKYPKYSITGRMGSKVSRETVTVIQTAREIPNSMLPYVQCSSKVCCGVECEMMLQMQNQGWLQEKDERGRRKGDG
jgi:hypothetical protein